MRDVPERDFVPILGYAAVSSAEHFSDRAAR